VTTWDQDQGGSNPNGHRNVKIVITEVGNDLRFDITIVDPQNNDDLRALFFNVKGDAVSGLAIKESWVAGVGQATNFASRIVANDVDYVTDKNEKLSGNYDNHKIKNTTFSWALCLRRPCGSAEGPVMKGSSGAAHRLPPRRASALRLRPAGNKSRL
jgi:hypothetical protein